MNELELKRERRKQRALERLGSNNPRCVACGFDDPLALELHHLAGRAFGDDWFRSAGTATAGSATTRRTMQSVSQIRGAKSSRYGISYSGSRTCSKCWSSGCANSR